MSSRVAAQRAGDRTVSNRTHGPFRGPGDPDMDDSIPAPSAGIGHALGVGAVRYDPLVRYLHALADSSPLVTLTPYAETHEGRTLFFLTITSEANHARLEKIRADNAKLFDPRKLRDQAEGDRIIETLPGIAWLSYSIHGDELSSTDAAVAVAYQLTAGTDNHTRRLRDELVIHIDPLMNADGRERYLGQLQHLTGKVSSPDYQAMQHTGLWSAGRGNHYLFDLNRDWLMQVHPETRGRAARILGWHPHLVVDAHEMGGLDTYLFDPPREPFNTELSTRNMFWRRRFSADQAKAFDKHGWSYYTREWYEEWYPGYTNSWSNLLGSVGLLYEQAGVAAASLKQRAGNTLTYREAVHHHVVSSLANLETLRASRKALLRDVLADRRSLLAVEADDPAGSVKDRFFLLPPVADRSRFNRFLDLLGRHGVEVTMAVDSFDATRVVDVWGQKHDHRSMPAGTLIVDSVQPNRRLLRAILGFDPHMSNEFLEQERGDLERHRGSRVYDITAWNLSMAYGLPAFWAGSVGGVSTRPARAIALTERDLWGTRPAYGYLIDGRDGNIHQALVHLLGGGAKVRVARQAFTLDGQRYQPGSLLIRNNENGDGLAELIRRATADLNLDVRPARSALAEDGPDLGGRRFALLAEPRIAIASQWPISTTSFGALWYLLDARLGQLASPINIQALGRMDLRKYNVLVLPHSYGPRALGGVLTKPVVKKLKRWVENGGTLIALGGSAAFLAQKEQEFSRVRLKRQELDRLDEYNEALSRERSARRVVVNPAEVWGDDDAIVDHTDRDDATGSADGGGSDKGAGHEASKKPPHKKDADEKKRFDQWQRLFRPGGAFVAAELDPQHWLTFGLVDTDEQPQARLPVLISGSYAFLSKHPVETPVRLGSGRAASAARSHNGHSDAALAAASGDPSDAVSDHFRLSGLLWPEARARLRDTAYATVERMGKGQIILFASDPFFRGYTEGTGRLLLNALMFGPGLGTTQPVPW